MIYEGDISWCPTIVPNHPTKQQPFEKLKRRTWEDKFVVLKAVGIKKYTISNKNKGDFSVKKLSVNAKPSTILPNLFVCVSFIKLPLRTTRSKPDYVFMNVEKPYVVVPKFTGIIRFHSHNYGFSHFEKTQTDDLENEHEYMCDCCNKGSSILAVKEHGNFCLGCCSEQICMFANKITYNGNLYERMHENFHGLGSFNLDFFRGKHKTIQELTNPQVHDVFVVFSGY